MKFPISLVVLFSLGLSGCNKEPAKQNVPVTDPSGERVPQKDYVLERLHSHVLAIRPKGNEVEFVTDGDGPGSSNQYPKEIVVGPGQTFWSMRDHHGDASLIVKEIRKNSVILTYQSSFDGRSFGKGVDSENREIELPFK